MSLRYVPINSMLRVGKYDKGRSASHMRLVSKVGASLSEGYTC
jgi:hypothetical protein